MPPAATANPSGRQSKGKLSMSPGAFGSSVWSKRWRSGRRTISEVGALRGPGVEGSAEEDSVCVAVAGVAWARFVYEVAKTAMDTCMATGHAPDRRARCRAPPQPSRTPDDRLAGGAGASFIVVRILCIKNVLGSSRVPGPVLGSAGGRRNDRQNSLQWPENARSPGKCAICAHRSDPSADASSVR